MKKKLNSQLMPVVPIRLASIPVPLVAVIDTGCRDNIIFTNNNPFEDVTFKRTGLNYGCISINGDADGIEVLEKISIGKYEFELKFGLIKGNFMGAHVLLGSNFLFENNMSLYINGENFILKKASSLEYFVCRTGILSY